MATATTGKRKRGRPKGSKNKKTLQNATLRAFVSSDMSKKEPEQLNASEARKEVGLLREDLRKLLEGSVCRICGKFKPKKDFYACSDPMCVTGVSPICKDCAKDIAYRKDEEGNYNAPTKESLIMALKYLDKPFIETCYNASIQEADNINKAMPNTTNFVAKYFKNIQMIHYSGMTFADSDFYKGTKYDAPINNEEARKKLDANSRDQFVQDKHDTIKLLHYDPFVNEKVEDQPFLYAQLVGLLDASEDSNDDMMRNASCISIVRGFLQESKIDDAIAQLMVSSSHMTANASTIKNLQDSKKKVLDGITNLAQENCISLRHTKNSTKGENTWTGKLKKIKNMNLREAEVNGFDMKTCKGMKQVMDMSNQSILKALQLDESEYSDMIAEQRKMITNLENQKNNFKEMSRVLLRENLDLKDLMKEKHVISGKDMVNIDDLISQYSGDEHYGENVLEDVAEVEISDESTKKNDIETNGGDSDD